MLQVACFTLSSKSSDKNKSKMVKFDVLKSAYFNFQQVWGLISIIKALIRR